MLVHTFTSIKSYQRKKNLCSPLHVIWAGNVRLWMVLFFLESSGRVKMVKPDLVSVTS